MPNSTSRNFPFSVPFIDQNGIVSAQWQASLISLAQNVLAVPQTNGYLIASNRNFVSRTFGVGSNQLSITNANGFTGNTTYDLVPGNVNISTLGGNLLSSQLPIVNFAPGVYGDAANVSTVTVNQNGLSTSVTSTPIQIAESQVTNLTTDLSSINTSITSINSSISSLTTTVAGKLTASNNLSDLTNVATANVNLIAVTSVSGVTTLSSSAYGTNVTCTGSSGYTVTLPAAVANEWIDFTINTTSNALVTITPASGTINGQSSIKLGTFEGCRLTNNGTNWTIKSISLQPVNCKVYLGVAQTITTTTITQIAYDTALFDVGSFCDLTVNKGRYTPLYPGKYKVTMNASEVAATAGSFLIGYIYLNGAVYSENAMTTVNTNTSSVSASDVVTLNGTTDFIDARVQQITGVNQSLAASSSLNYMSITRVSLF